MIDMLEQAASARGDRPPDGGIFLPESSIPSSVVDDGFYPDLIAAARAVDTILSRCKSIESAETPTGIKALHRSGLEGDCEDFSTDLSEHLRRQNGFWWIGVGGVIRASSAQQTALKRDFGQAPPGEWPERSFVIPTKNVTAARVLPFPTSDEIFKPILDLRIQTSADKPVSYFDGPGSVAERASLGSWFCFPLADLKLVVLG